MSHYDDRKKSKLQALCQFLITNIELSKLHMTAFVFGYGLKFALVTYTAKRNHATLQYVY